MKLITLAAAAATLAAGMAVPAAAAQRTVITQHTVVTHQTGYVRPHTRTVCHRERHGHRITRVCRTVRY